MIINNGIISSGNHNKNTIQVKQDINFSNVQKELEKLLKHCNEHEIIKECLKHAEQGNKNKLIKGLKKLSKEAISMIKTLALSTLQALINKYL